MHHIDIDVTRLRTAFDTDTDALAGTDLLKLVGQVRKAVNRLAIGLNDHVTDRAGVQIDATDAGALGRTSRRGANDDHAFDTEARRHGFTGGDNADAGRRHATVLDQFRHD